MNTIERERPIRLTFAGEVESYDWQSAQWIRDLSRDPRELASLTYPPAADAYLSTKKTTCANAVTHQLKAQLKAQNSIAGDTSTVAIDDAWDAVFYQCAALAQRAAIDPYQPVWNPLIHLIVAEFWLVDLSAFPENSTFWEKVTCHMWCHMSDNCTFTYENWLALIQAIFDDSTLGDAQQWLKLMVILLGRKGLTNLGFLKVNDNDVLDPATDCTCV